ncbi:MAG: GNAT family N-acetyltransferase [Actinomycetota bacterium]|nr:GNAT family N-acetyltransferase [Actinomycetota bacterium]MDQ2894417.1 GNAT family N-acetyltransferase [Actinomycetota bacterium]
MTTSLDGADALRVDGRSVHIRSLGPEDRAALLELDRRASDRSIYLRFFSASRYSADAYIEQLLRPPGPDHLAIGAIVAGLVVGVASFERIGPDSAEFALLIEDASQHLGIGTLLIEHLAASARHRAITTLRADVLTQNATMINVIRALGLPITTTQDGEVQQVSVGLTPDVSAATAVDERDRGAVEASLRPLLAPRSIAVIGAGSRPNTVGHEVLRNIQQGGFTGELYAVNPNHDTVLDVRCYPAPGDLPVAPDLAVVAVPAAGVLQVVEACGERGVRGIMVLTAGFGETGPTGVALQGEVLRAVRRHGMRMIGPNCLGLVNTDARVRLNATFGPMPMVAGNLGLVSQSGALGIAVLAAAQDCGLHVAQFVSVGNKADVSSNDLLLAWEQDPQVAVIALYLESFGNPRKFARIARRVSAAKPIIAIKAGRSRAGQRAGLSHTAAAASSDSVVDALFTEAGVIRVDSMQDMLDATRVLCDQPLPAGARLAIVGNSGGPGILAADAAERASLTVVELATATKQRLQDALPHAASRENPIDLGAGVQPADLARAVEILLDAPEVDMVLAIFTETLVADSAAAMDAVAQAARGSAKPVVATQVGAPPRSISIPGAAGAVPVFTFPEPAVSALATVARYARIRARTREELTRPAHAERDLARSLVSDRLTRGAGWLGAGDTAELLSGYGIPMSPQRVVADADAAARAASEFGYPVAIKVAAGLVHKSDVGGVRLGITSELELRAAFDEVRAAGPLGGGVLVQPMAATGTELIVGAIQDPQFGPVVMLGAGGVMADMIADRQLRLAPVTAAEAQDMIAGLRTAPLLDGYRGRPPVSRPAVADLLTRVALLAEELPEIAELDLNPVICEGERVLVVDAKVRLAPAAPGPDRLLRDLRS